MFLQDRFPGFLKFLYICVYIYQFRKWDSFNSPVSIKKGIAVLKLTFLWQDNKKKKQERCRMHNYFVSTEKHFML